MYEYNPKVLPILVPSNLCTPKGYLDIFPKVLLIFSQKIKIQFKFVKIFKVFKIFSQIF